MGGHANYRMIIRNIIQLKKEFHLITAEKYQALINELLQYEIVPNSDNDHLPDHIRLSQKLNYSQSKTNSLIKGLRSSLLDAFNEHPLVINNIVHILQIFPYKFRDDANNNGSHEEWKKAVVIRTVLPVTPRIGEFIDLSFTRTYSGFDTDLPYNDGYVHDVRHNITGTTQEISIEIYPFRSFYYRWMDLKNEYEDTISWRAKLKKSNL